MSCCKKRIKTKKLALACAGASPPVPLRPVTRGLTTPPPLFFFWGLFSSGALGRKSISFAKQSGRLPQHRGVMESDGWPPIPGTTGQSIITPPVNIAASITYRCRPLKSLCHGACCTKRSVCACVCEGCLATFVRLQRIVSAWLIICGHMRARVSVLGMCLSACSHPSGTSEALVWMPVMIKAVQQVRRKRRKLFFWKEGMQHRFSDADYLIT